MDLEIQKQIERDRIHKTLATLKHTDFYDKQRNAKGKQADGDEDA